MTRPEDDDNDESECGEPDRDEPVGAIDREAERYERHQRGER